MAGTLTTQTVVYHSVSVYNYLYPIFRFCADTFCRLMSFSGVIVCALGVNVAENLSRSSAALCVGRGGRASRRPSVRPA